MLDIDACLRYLVESGGSDLHLKVPARPLVRLDGERERISALGARRLRTGDPDFAPVWD